MTTPLRALIIEDNRAHAMLMAYELTEAGFDLTWELVSTEEDFLTQLDARPDIILCDLHLPQFDAWRVLELMRERAVTIPLIVVSMAPEDEVARELIALGATAFLGKDRLGQELAGIIRRVLRL